MSTHPLFLIVVFDGLRADMVTPETMPNLCRFQEDGTSFPNARSVYPTSTRTNAAALATGSTPRHNGIVQNKYFDPNIFHDDVFHPGQFADIAAGMAAYGGDLLTTPSLGDIAARGGYAMASFLTGGTGTSRLVNPRAAEHGHISLGFNGWENSCPTDIAQELVAAHGPIPESVRPNIDAINLQTDMTIESLYPNHQPDILVLWYSEPDQTHHYHGVASEKMGQAISLVDTQFGRLLDWWRDSGLQDRLQIIAVSDHGQITARKRVDVNAEAAKAGFAIDDHFDGGADYAGYTSYSGSMKVRDDDPNRMAAMVEWLTDQPWCGLIFTPGGNGIEGQVPGTFDHALGLIDHPRSPDIYYVMRNDDAVFGDGIVGSCFYNGVYPEGGGTHGGLHPKELNIVLAAQGTLFEAGLTPATPAGIIDIAPTILHLLGLSQPTTMDGRILTEALASSDEAPGEPETTVHTVERGGLAQFLKFTQVGRTSYLDAGWIE